MPLFGKVKETSLSKLSEDEAGTRSPKVEDKYELKDLLGT